LHQDDGLWEADAVTAEPTNCRGGANGAASKERQVKLRVKLIVFDFDGTLVDSRALILECHRTVFTEFHLPPPSSEDSLALIGKSLDWDIDSSPDAGDCRR
jgi:hypothetical protein